MVASGLLQVSTPALVVDRRVLLANIALTAANAAAAGVALRPHAKTHKSLAIAALQRNAGAIGLTVATIQEAEAFADAGFDDILLAAPPTGAWRLERLTAVAARARIRVTVDSVEAVRELNSACAATGVEIGYLWELDCGVGRFGTPPGTDSARIISQACALSTACRFDGLLTFGGHAYAALDKSGVASAARDEREAIATTVEALDAHRIGVVTGSIGTTPTSHYLEPSPGVTEIRPGNYVFHDATAIALGIVDESACALTVLTTVLSRPSPERLILDAGSKALAAERISTLTSGFGLIVGHPKLRVERLYEEQAIVVGAEECTLRAGDRVLVIPNHACAALNLHAQMLVVEDSVIVDVWPVDVRGWAAEREAVAA